MLKVEHIFVSAGHNFFGHHGKPAGEHPMAELEQVECVAGHGLRGDRFFDYRDNYKGQVTLFAGEVFDALCEAFRLEDVSPAALRRNLVVRGEDLNELIGQEFELQGVRLAGIEECRPCYWMDSVVGQGAEKWLKSRAGLRCRIMTSGWLRRDAQ